MQQTLIPGYCGATGKVQDVSTKRLAADGTSANNRHRDCRPQLDADLLMRSIVVVCTAATHP